MRSASARIAAIFLLVLGSLAGSCRAASADDPPKPAKKDGQLGLLINDPRASQGYTLLAPANSMNTYLIDTEGRIAVAHYGAHIDDHIPLAIITQWLRTLPNVTSS